MSRKAVAISSQTCVERPRAEKTGLDEGRLPWIRRQQGVGSYRGAEAIIAEDSRSCLNRKSMFLF